MNTLLSICQSPHIGERGRPMPFAHKGGIVTQLMEVRLLSLALLQYGKAEQTLDTSDRRGGLYADVVSEW